MQPSPRLLWRCRRGTREMDLMLEAFLRRVYPQLDRHEREVFDGFLNETDADILDWVSGRARPDTLGYEDIVQHLQQLRLGND